MPWKKQGASLRPRRRDCESLRQAEIRRMERIQTAFEQLGAGIHSRPLSVANLVRAQPTFRPCLLSKQFGNREITNEMKLDNDLGADSLDVIEIIIALEEEFNIEISDDLANEVETVKDLNQIVISLIGGVKN